MRLLRTSYTAIQRRMMFDPLPVGRCILGTGSRRRLLILLHDASMVGLAWFGAFWMRFNLDTIPPPYWQQALTWLPLVVVWHIVTLSLCRVPRGQWRFTSMPDAIRLIQGVVLAVGLSIISIALLTRLSDLPRSVFILHSLLAVGLLATPRLIYRRWWMSPHSAPTQRVLIIGAGQTGERLVRELLQTGCYRPVAFLDDDPAKRGTDVHGIRVVGTTRRLRRMAERAAIDLVLIAIPTIARDALHRLITECSQLELPIRIVPRLHDLLANNTLLPTLREVAIEDLLGREPVSLDWAMIRSHLHGQRVLITGGGGSIGAELCRQVAALNPSALIILERHEFNLYRIDSELRQRWPHLPLHSVLADICDPAALQHFFTRLRPDIVFHAAAYKHVPLLEPQVREAVRNNLLGTIQVASAALRTQCHSMVLISTDKAVHPCNVMGLSKRLAELYCQHLDTPTTRFITVRFGNVLDSTGSVVPLFRQQIACGGPVTVTHPEVTRYFMTISEACQLILQAAALGEQGDIYVLDMGKPISIVQLAEQLIRLSGKQPGRDIAIQFTGLRPGEKLHEALFYEDEQPVTTPYPKLRLARRNRLDALRYQQFLSQVELACQHYDETRLMALLATWSAAIQPETSAQTSVEREVAE